jgi:glycerophosphoryl diester phosphodiesterase|tara:strand:- start:15 stop:638 length:624 start_codon:yes stop_codon:yes gene_type:complete
MHIIHRGIVNKNYKENCLESFIESFKRKFGIETDIHTTKDNEFVCFHDFTLRRIFKINKSIKNINYKDLKKFKIPLLNEVLELSNNKFPIFIEIKPLLNKKLLSKLINETKKFKKCIFISFKHENIQNLLKINSKVKVGISFSNKDSVKSILKYRLNKKIKYLILDKRFLDNKKVQLMSKEKYYYTIKTRKEFFKYNKNNNLIFENL